MGSKKRVSKGERVLEQRLDDRGPAEKDVDPLHSISIMDDEGWAAIRFVRKASNMECPYYACDKWGVHSYPCGIRTYVNCTIYKNAVITKKIDKKFERKMRELAYVGIYLGQLSGVERKRTLGELCPELDKIKFEKNH